MPETFYAKHRVVFADANPQGTMYWSNYCEVVGRVREEFLFSVLTDDKSFRQMQEAGIAIETCEFSSRYLKPTFLGDVLIVKLNVTNLRRMMVELLVDFVKIGADGVEETVAKTRQKLLFFDVQKGKPTNMPETVHIRAAEYEIPDPNHKS